VKTFNKVMRYIPFSIKYGIGQSRRQNRFPYCLIDKGKTVVQVGAPMDTLRSGRSRALHFALRTGEKGKTIIIEPDKDSEEWFGIFVSKHDLPQIKFVPYGAWNEKKTLSFYINPSHPATNFTEGTRRYSDKEMTAYKKIDMPANTIDNILEELKIKSPFLVSITTNGAESEILKGLEKSMLNGLPYISLAKTGEKYIELMNNYGYRLHAHDDRGYTFKRV